MPYQCKFQRKFINSIIFFLKSHLNENKKEISLVKEEFPNESYTAVYDKHNLLNGKVSKWAFSNFAPFVINCETRF